MLPEKYAKALYESVEGRSEREQDELFSNFLKVLKRNGHFSLLSRILKNFNKVVFKEKTDTSIDFIISDAKFEDRYKSEIKKYSNYFGEYQKIQTKTDDSLIGGFILRSKDVVIDGSYKRSLVSLYNRFVK